VIFPGVVSTLFVGRNKSINALNAAMASEKKNYSCSTEKWIN
jgi:ATP-dependent Lon protease